MKAVFLGLLAGLLALPAYANEAKMAGASAMRMNHIARLAGMPCSMQENVTLNVTFNIKAKSFADAKTKYDEKMKQLDDFAKQQGIQKFDMQSMNYNINAQVVSYEEGQPVVGAYQLNGNASYRLDSADNAFKLAEFLTQQKFQVGVNVNSYRNGMCNNPAME